jgi:hypothetical protein
MNSEQEKTNNTADGKPKAIPVRLNDWLYVFATIIKNIFSRTEWYYISATGLDHDDRRMFVGTALKTVYGQLPLTAFENKVKEMHGWKTCVILSFQKMTKKQAKYYDYPVKSFGIIDRKNV